MQKSSARTVPVAVSVTLALVLSLLGFTIPGQLAFADPGEESGDSSTAESVQSPDGTISVEVSATDGVLRYQVDRDQSTIVSPSTLGFVLKNPALDLTSGFSIDSVERREIDETWTPAWGTSAKVRNHANELTVHAVHDASGAKLDVIVRVFDDGVGIRYRFPQQDVLGTGVIIAKESTQFVLPTDLTAYSIRSGTDWNADEKHYKTEKIVDVPNAQTPITFSRAYDNLYMSVHEAALIDYPSMTLVRTAPGTFESSLISLPNGDKAVIDVGPDGFNTPWRTIQMTRRAGALGESHLIENLNDPCKICDVDSDGDGVADTTDWIDPGTYVGVWWELQRRDTTWTSGPKHGATTARVKQYMDLASQMGAKYVLAEGWNTNAGGSWSNQDFLTPMADFDLGEVLSYGKTLGVKFIAHNETRGNVDYYDQHMDQIFAQYKQWGIPAIKTGYATKFLLGGVNRSHYDQEAVRHYQRVIDTAAKYGISVDAHEAIKPTGLNRTYPNMMSGEGVAGMEQQNYMGANGNPPEQVTILPFTRWIGGPADYTPGVLNVLWDPSKQNTRVQSTIANQLALYSTFFSPLQMLADTPENYALFANAAEYLRNMPTTWDETRVLDAVIGDYTVTARRSGDIWYLGAVTDENDRTVSIPLGFLGEGTKYVAEIYADAADTSWKGNPTAIEISSSLVDSSTALEASMVGAGGYAVKLRSATEDDIRDLPEYSPSTFHFVGDPTTTYDPITSSVRVDVTVKNTGISAGSVGARIDGVSVPTDGSRVAPGMSTSLSWTVPAGEVVYPGPNRIELVAPGSTDSVYDWTEVSLLPVPDRALLDLVKNLHGVSPTSKVLLVDKIQRALAAKDAQNFDGVRKAMQWARWTALSASVTDVSAGALVDLDSAFRVYLGHPYGYFGILEGVRDAEQSAAVATADAITLRQESALAAKQAVAGDAAEASVTLDQLLELLSAAQGDPTVIAKLTELVNFQKSSSILEAENATLVGGTKTNKEHPGYTGSGFVRDLSKLDAGVHFTVNVPVKTAINAEFRYANGMVVLPLDRQLSMTVNAGQVQTVQFPNLSQASDRWRQWAYAAPYPAEMNQGSNDLFLFYGPGDSGNINLDHLRITAASGVLSDTWIDPENPGLVDPAKPTRSRNVLTIPDAVGVSYVDDAGNALVGEIAVPLNNLVVKAVAEPGYKLNPESRASWLFPYDMAARTMVDPVKPDRTGNTVTIPVVQGVTYRGADGSVLTGQVPVTIANLTVFATPAAGYRLNPELRASWLFPYDMAARTMVDPIKPVRDGRVITIPEIAAVVYKDGAGNVLTGEVTIPNGSLVVLASPPTGYRLNPEVRASWLFPY